jgi:hypothetical protein
MLKALVAAADAALETSIRSVLVSSYDLSILSVYGNIQSGLKDVVVNSWTRNWLEHVARSIALRLQARETALTHKAFFKTILNTPLTQNDSH